LDLSRDRFTLIDAAGICLPPFLAREEQRETCRQLQATREARRAAGVRWSGLSPDPPAPTRSPEMIRADAEAALARAASFAASPRGRLLHSLAALSAAGAAPQAEGARSAFARGFADPGRPACPAEIGCALDAIGRLALPQARHACRALSDLLLETLAA
jgi:hypothetical protein